MLAVDLSQLPHALRTKIDELFRQDHDLRLHQAMREQEEIAAEFHRQQPRSIDGIGEQTMALHPYIDACNRALVGSVRWSNDRDLRRWYLKKYPQARVRCGGTKIQVGYRGNQPQTPGTRAGQLVAVSAGEKRFTKVYA